MTITMQYNVEGNYRSRKSSSFLILCTPVLHSHVINHDMGILLLQLIVDN